MIPAFRLLTALLFLWLSAVSYGGQRAADGQSFPEDKAVSVFFFDVAQGDAALVRTPGGQNILIDGGSPSYRLESGETVTAKEVYPLLKALGIDRIDTVIVSHSHGDHVAGLVKVLEQLPVRQVLLSGRDDGDQSYAECRSILQRKKIPCRTVKAGDSIAWDHGVKAEVWGPPSGFSFNGGNNDSIILKMVYGDVGILFPGDAEADEQDWAAGKYGKRIAADILKVPHHGSYNSLNGSFLSAVAPSVAIFSCGQGNPFGHPHKKTTDFYRRKGISLLRTDQDGTIQVTTDGRSYTVRQMQAVK